MKVGNAKADIVSPIQAEMRLLEIELEKVFTSRIGLVADISRHLLATRGKRIRPILVLLVSKMGSPSVEESIKVATAVELIHTATLLHDDSIDHNHLRRGVPTVNHVWDDQISVIMGDYLFCSAFEILHEAGLFEVASVLSSGSRMVTKGEMYQMDLRGRYDITEEQYIEMVRQKTAALFASACEAGAIIGRLGISERVKLRAYGDNLGIAFQIIDDVLDYVGDINVMGKPVGNDLRDGRITLPLISSLREASGEEVQSIIRTIGFGSIDSTAWRKVVDFIKEHNGIDYAVRLASSFAHSARACLTGIEESPSKQSLLLTADQVVIRQQ